MNLPLDIYLDTCDIKEIARAIDTPVIQGVTTNPTLMRKAGVTDYMRFARTVLELVGEKAVAFEVVTEDPDKVIEQALKLQALGTNVNVKVPMLNSRGESNLKLIAELIHLKVHVNITAIISLYQVSQVLIELPAGPAILSVFAGRLADTGHSPVPHMQEAVKKLRFHPGKRLLWASVREPLNIYEAAHSGCHIVTVPTEMLTKAILWHNRSPDTIAAETSQQFINDATSAGLTL